tara:strand:+ start:1772 stop:2461 length:690 start_codon:yes stop_codon:yes gene_type:complete
MPKTKKAKKKNLDFKTLGQNNASVKVPPFHLQNVVSTFCLGVSGLNLHEIANRFGCLEFNPQNFAAATIRTIEPRTTALAFASGNMVVTGSKSTTESRLAARKYVRIFQKLGIPVMFKNFEIQNVVASANAGFPIKLKDIADKFGLYVSFTPDLFPGLIFRSINPKLVFLIFRSGKIVITGARNVQDIKMTYESLYRNILVNFRDRQDAPTSSSQYRNELRRNRDTSDL